MLRIGLCQPHLQRVTCARVDQLVTCAQFDQRDKEGPAPFGSIIRTVCLLVCLSSLSSSFVSSRCVTCDTRLNRRLPLVSFPIFATVLQ